jgi:hypothetical protein
MPAAICSIISGKNLLVIKKAANAATAKIPSHVSQLVDPEPLIDINAVLICYRAASSIIRDEVRKTIRAPQKA